MTDKKRSAKARKNNILLPHVDDAPQGALQDEEISGGALRAQQTVDGLIRDLFGKEGGVGLATRGEDVPLSELDTKEVIVEEPVQEEPTPPETLEQIGVYPAFVQDDLQVEAELAQSEGYAQPLSFKEQIEASAEEFRLLLDMEYEQELGEAIGFERIRTYHENTINGRRGTRKHRAEAGVEFEAQEQETEIRQRYGRAKRKSILRLCVTVLFFAMLLVYENVELMRSLLGDILDISQYPTPYILLGLQLLLLDAALCYKPLREGLVHILQFSPVDHSPYVLLLLLTFAYHLLLILFAHEGAPRLFLAPAAFSLVLLAVSELLNLYRQTLAFDVVAAHRQKYAILPRISVGGAQGSARARLAQGSLEGNRFYLHPVGFVRNYIQNTEKHGAKYQNLGAHFLLIAGIGAALSLFGFAGGAEPQEALTLFFAAILLCAPAISSLLTAMPLFFAGCFALRGKGAIIGEMPLAECGKNDVLILPDHELFVAMEQRQFRLVGLCDAHRVSVLARALLEKTQSPLAASISVDSDSRISPAALTFSHIGKEGVMAEIAQTGDAVAIGTARYLLHHGIQLPASVHEEKEGEIRPAGCAPLYIAVDGAACAMLTVRYVLAADAEHLLYRLQRAGFRLTVRSMDPCVREEVFRELFPDLVHPVKVEKPAAGEIALRTDRVDSNVVALGSCKELARTLLTCRRVQRVGAWGKLLQLLCVVGGGAVAALLPLFEVQLSSLFITLWMLSWCVIYALLSYFSLRRATDDI